MRTHETFSITRHVVASLLVLFANPSVITGLAAQAELKNLALTGGIEDGKARP